MNFVNIDIKPPKSNVVISTTTKVELTSKPLFGDSWGLIYSDRAKAIAPLILPLNQMRSSCFIEILISKYLQIPTKREGMKTPQALAKMQENSTAIIKKELNFSYSIP
jgi:hypothetical protein